MGQMVLANDRGIWRRFRRSGAAMVGAALLVVMVLMSGAALPYSSHWFDVQAPGRASRTAPAMHPVVPWSRYAEAGRTARSVTLDDARPAGSVDAVAHGVSSWWGHDSLGRSLFYRCQLGLIVSLVIGLAAALMAIVIGVGWGAAAAYAGGRIDALMMRIVDVLYALPYVLTVVLIRVALERPLSQAFGDRALLANIVMVIIAIVSVSWLTMARVVRGQVLSLREQPFVEAARAMGLGSAAIVWRHILPNVVGPIAVYATLVVPQAVMQESFLSFLGIGVQQPLPSLGRLAADGVQSVNTFVGYWWLIVFPCGLLVVALVALNFVGDGLRDAFDPKSGRAASFLHRAGRVVR